MKTLLQLRNSIEAKELNGEIAEHRTRSANREVERYLKDVSIDSNDVVRNSIGRVIMDDAVSYLFNSDNITAYQAICTMKQRDVDVAKQFKQYREEMKNHKVSDEEKFEMTAAYGKGKVVVNVITGQRTYL